MVIMCSGGAISWMSKKQTIVAQSSKEAEFVALSYCIREVLWLMKFKLPLQRIVGLDSVKELFDICIREDNQACILDAKNHVLSDLSKPIDLKYQLLVDHIRKGTISLT